MPTPILHAHRDTKPEKRAPKPREPFTSPMPTRATTNHVLNGGQALCGLAGPPCDWPPGNAWVGFNDPIGARIVNCAACRKALGVAKMLEGRR